MLINSHDCSTCLFSRYGLLIMLGGVGGDFSQTRPIPLPLVTKVRPTSVVCLNWSKACRSV